MFILKFKFRPILVIALAWIFTGSLAAQTPKSGTSQNFNLIRWNHGKFLYGADYYPEAWPQNQWAQDARRMHAAGINFVRMGEFAWVKMEPAEGQYHFGWLDQALQTLAAQGIHAVLGTPTAAPPAWLYSKYPDIAAVNRQGIAYRFGSRRDYSLLNPHFLAATRAIVTAEAEHFKNNPAVIGFQIDNELGNPYCYDRYCQAAFQAWCRKKYHTLAGLNRAWGTIFWGHTYTAWTQIPLPWNTLFGVVNPSLALDYDRFFDQATRNFLDMQAQILRRIAPTKAITTNEMGMFDAIDYSKLNRALDFVAWDNYPMFDQRHANYFGPGLSHDLMRGSKDGENFMVMEEEGGLPGWTTFWGRQAAPGLYRVWAYQAIAHGADGVCYFRWRTSRYGTEQYWQGILDQDSYPNTRYRMIARMGKEVQRLRPWLEGTEVRSQIAMLISPASRWAFHIQPLTKGFDYNRQLLAYYRAFRRRGANVDVVFPQQDFSQYKLLIAPSLFVVTPQLEAKLSAFVRGGGVLVLTYRSGVKNGNNVFTARTLPGRLARLAGVEIHDYDPATTQRQAIAMNGKKYPAGVWFDILTPGAGTQTLARYARLFYRGQAAVSLHPEGRGAVIYVGTEPSSHAFYNQFAALAARRAGVHLSGLLPAGVEEASREKAGTRLIFLLNYTGQPKTVALGIATRNALTGGSVGAQVKLPGYGVRVLIESDSAAFTFRR